MIVCPSCGRPAVDLRSSLVNPPAVCPCDSLYVAMFVHGALGTCFSWHITGDGFRMVCASTPEGVSHVSVYTRNDGWVGRLERMPDWADAAGVVAAMFIIDS